MQNFKFLHAADLHLDSPLLGLESHEEAPIETIRNATREALRNLVDHCIAEGVNFLLIAGDVFDGDWKSAESGRFFAQQMLRLASAEQPIPVFMVKGNHDAISILSRDLPVENVFTFSAVKAQTKMLPEIGVAIHGRSYSRPDTTDDISQEYPAPVQGSFNIGILHTCAGGRPGHERYAPCEIEALKRKGYDYWALGHVHRREIISDNPYIIFPGNLQGRKFVESAPEGKGCTEITVENGIVVRAEHKAFDVVRWSLLEVDISECATAQEATSQVIAELRQNANSIAPTLLATRIKIVGISEASPEIFKDLTSFTLTLREHVASLALNAWIEDILVECRSNILNDDDVGASIQGVLSSVREFAEANEADLRKEKINPLLSKIRPIAPELAEESGLSSESLINDLLPEIEEVIAAVAKESLSR